MWRCLLVLAALLAVCAHSAPLPQQSVSPSASINKSAFIPAFDEIVVESSLTVKSKSGQSPNTRQGRTKLLVVPTPGITTSTTTTTTATAGSSTTSSNSL